VIDWAAIAWKTAPIVAGRARAWWNRDAAKNLARLVAVELEKDPRYPPGVRDQLVEQWSYVQDDEILATIVQGLLLDPEPETERLVKPRLREQHRAASA
jgi:hypothetical protein